MVRKLNPLLLFGSAILLANDDSLWAQGDTCAIPTAISVLQSYPFNSAPFSTSGFNGGGLCAPGASNINQDVFWQWIAPLAGDFDFDTFGSSFDTQISVHLGTGCSAQCEAYNDDAPGTLDSAVRVFGLNAGDQVLVQVGGWDMAAGIGVLNIQQYINPCNGLPDDTFEPNDSCANPAALLAAPYSGLHVDISDPDFYSISVPAGFQLSLQEDFDSNDCDYRLWSAACGTELVDSQQSDLAYSNLGASPQAFVIEAHQWAGASLSCSDYGFTLTLAPDPCAGQAEDTLEPNDTCLAPHALSPGSYVGLHVSLSDPDFYAIQVPAGSILTVNEASDSGATDYNLYYSGCGSQVVQSALQSLTFRNETGFNQTMILEAHHWAGFQPLCSDYSIDVSLAQDPCVAGNDDGLEENDDCTNPHGLADGTFPSLFVSKTDGDFYSFCLAPGASLQGDIVFDTGIADLDLFLWEAQNPTCGDPNGGLALASSESSSNNESLLFLNSTQDPMQLVLEVRVWSLSPGDCNVYNMQIAGSGNCSGVLNTFCDPMDPNSTGAPTTLVGAMGSGLGSGLRLEASSGPPGQFAYFLVGTMPTQPGLPLGQGRLCLATGAGNSVGRYNVGGSARNSLGQFDAAGILQNAVGTSASGSGFDVPTGLPLAGSPSITGGQTWHFQLWHRESGGSSNFSNGISIGF